MSKLEIIEALETSLHEVLMRDGLEGPASKAAIVRGWAVLFDARKIIAAAKSIAPPSAEPKALVYLFDHANGVVVGGSKHGWLVWRHPDGQWVTVQKAATQDPMECIPDVLRPAGAPTTP
jgi:hypothetical protein